jgi:hypothetical protein
MTSLFAAAKPWTYWMAPPLLAATVLLVLGMAIRYYRRILAPQYQWELHAQQPPATQTTVGTAHRIGVDAEPHPKAA